MLDDSFKLTLD